MSNRILLPLCLLLGAVLALYLPTLGHDFIYFDDDVYVYENAQVTSGVTPDSIAWAFTTTHASNWHPLTWISHMLDVQLFGLNPTGHHLTNLLLHAVTAALMLLVLQATTGAAWLSALVAILFAVHPLHVESVAWVAERKDLLSAFFGMLAVAAYVGYLRRPGAARYIWVFLAFSMSLLAKPMTVTLPFLLLLLDFWPLGRFRRVHPGAGNGNPRSGGPWGLMKGPLLEKAPLLLLSALSSVATYYAQSHSTAMASLGALGAGTRIANALSSYGKYILKMIWPTRLTLFYTYPQRGELVWQAPLAALLLILFSWLVIRTWRTRPYLVTGWLWYLGMLVPVIGLVQVGEQSMADRYTYLPYTGLFIAIAWGGRDAAVRWPALRRTFVWVLPVALVALTAAAAGQIGYWKDSVRLFSRTLEISPGSWQLHSNLGNALADRGRFGEAVGHYRKALLIEPSITGSYMNLALTLSQDGRGQEANIYYEAALKVTPARDETHRNLAVLLEGHGNLEDAIGHYRAALGMASGDLDTRYRLAGALEAAGRVDEAAGEYAGFLADAPGHTDAYFRLAGIRAAQGRGAESAGYYREVLRLEPDSPGAMNNLAWLLLSSGDDSLHDAAEAIRLAELACELTGHAQPDYLDTLAAAYAAADRFSEAVVTAERALGLAVAGGNEVLARQVRDRLQRYRPERSPGER